MQTIDVGGLAIEYLPSLADGIEGMHRFFADHHLHYMMSELVALPWIQHEKVPRKEYFVSDVGKPYAYGAAAYARTYHPQPWTDDLRWLQQQVEKLCDCKFEVCFLNYYETGKDQLGWHSDDSPEMDDNRPIVIATFGAEREIWFRRRPELGAGDPVKLVLQNSSVCIMPAGMQDTHQHRIPKAGIHNCGPRISLTFRGFVEPKDETL